MLYESAKYIHNKIAMLKNKVFHAINREPNILILLKFDIFVLKITNILNHYDPLYLNLLRCTTM